MTRIAMGVMAVLMAVLTGTLSGCGGKVGEKLAEKAIESSIKADGGDVDVDLEGDGKSFTMSVAGDEGDIQMVMGEKAKVPEGFPTDVPLYPGISLHLAQSAAADQQFTLQGTTTDALDKVVAFYQKETAKGGWEEKMAMKQTADQPMHILTYAKDNRMLNLMLTADEDGGAVINITTASE